MNYLIKALKLPFAVIPRRARVLILMGPLRGARWIVGSGNLVAWLGLYEFRKQVAFRRTVSAGSTVYDVGAHVGFYSLLASRLVGRRGRVVAFEPAPRNLWFLREHLRLNQAANVQVVEAAVSGRTGTAAFLEGASTEVDGSYLGHLVNRGGREVQTVSLDELVEAGRIPPPDCIKMDIEGGEVAALNGARALLERYRPTILLATHGPQLHHECLELLWSLAYRVRPLLSGRNVLETDELIAEPQPSGEGTVSNLF